MPAGTIAGASLGCLVYVISLVAVYAASTLSHSFRRPRLRHFFRTVDQVCIFFLIAGTYTPWGLAFYSEGWGWTLLVAMWALAFAGAGFKLFVTGHDNVGVAFYVLLGWLPALGDFRNRPSRPAGRPRLAGGGRALLHLGHLFPFTRRTTPLLPRHLAPVGHRRQCLPFLRHHALRRPVLLSGGLSRCRRGESLVRQPTSDAAWDHVWFWRVRLPERKDEPCRVIARGGKNSVLVEFADGLRVITSRYAVRKRGSTLVEQRTKNTRGRAPAISRSPNAAPPAPG